MLVKQIAFNVWNIRKILELSGKFYKVFKFFLNTSLELIFTRGAKF
jgi:hypothetical protein